MFNKLVTAALLTISLILLTGFNRPLAIQNHQNLLPTNKTSTQAAQAVKHF